MVTPLTGCSTHWRPIVSFAVCIAARLPNAYDGSNPIVYPIHPRRNCHIGVSHMGQEAIRSVSPRNRQGRDAESDKHRGGSPTSHERPDVKEPFSTTAQPEWAGSTHGRIHSISPPPKALSAGLDLLQVA